MMQLFHFRVCNGLKIKIKRRRKEGERGEASNLEKIYNVDDAVMTS